MSETFGRIFCDVAGVYVYMFDKSGTLDEEFVVRNISKMPPERQKRCTNYKHLINKANCIIAYLMLIYALKNHYRVNENPTFIYNECGKPFLKDNPEIFFSISHSNNYVVCAVSDSPIGIDIQTIRFFRNSAMEFSCTAKELELLLNSTGPEKLFCEFWTRKESYAKAKGIRVAEVFKSNLNDVNITSYACMNYIVSLTKLF